MPVFNSLHSIDLSVIKKKRFRQAKLKQENLVVQLLVEVDPLVQPELVLVIKRKSLKLYRVKK